MPMNRFSAALVVALVAFAGGAPAAERAPVSVVSHVKVLSDKVEGVSSLAAWRRSFIRNGLSGHDKALAARSLAVELAE